MSTLTFDIAPSDSQNPIGIEIWLDDQQIADHAQLDQKQNIVCSFSDDVEQTHTLKIVIKNKTSQHTQLDASGKIVNDSLIEINKFTLEEIDIDKIVIEKATYTHNLNGSGPEITDRFYGSAGCNGTVLLKFTSPCYLWMLENM